MNCQTVNQILLQNQIDEIPPSVRHEIEEHMSQCVSCRNNVILTKIEENVLKNAAVPSVSSDFIERTMQLLPSDLYKNYEKIPSSASPVRQKKKHHPGMYVGAVACCLLLIGAGFFIYRNQMSLDGSEVSVMTAQNETSSEKTISQTNSESSSLPVHENSTVPNPSRMGAGTSVGPERSSGINNNSLSITPVAYELNSTSSNHTIVNLNESGNTMIPYQYFPAVPSGSSESDSYPDPRNNPFPGSDERTDPDIILSGLPEDFHLIDFSDEISHYIFHYQNDLSAKQLNLTVAPYDPSSAFIDLPGDNTICSLITCEDMTYEVVMKGNLSEDVLMDIAKDIKIQQHESKN